MDADSDDFTDFKATGDLEAASAEEEGEDLGQQLPAVGAVSQDYIVIPAGPTGASPDASVYFQVYGIPTKVRAPSLVSHYVCAGPLLSVHTVCGTADLPGQA